MRRVFDQLRAYGAVKRADRLIADRRFAEAESVLTTSLRRLPRQRALLTRFALVAHNAGRYDEALARWRVLDSVVPGTALGTAAIACNLRELERLGEAQTAIAPALARYPDDTTVLSEAARIADHRYAHAEAFELWQRLVERQDGPPEWLQGRDRSLIMLGRLSEAEDAIQRSCLKHPHHRGHFINRAQLSMARGEWTTAIAQLNDHNARFSGEHEGLYLLGQAMEGRDLAAAEQPPAAIAAPVLVDRVVDDTLRGRLIGFESLGEDCEFGLVQRRYGAEPLGLLRWSGIAREHLIDGLRSGFAGLGDPTTTTINVFEFEEYYLSDTRYGMRMHTFQHRHQIAADVLLLKMTRRLNYLRGKLLEDLNSAAKVFVYKSATLSRNDVFGLHAALRQYGPVRLLGVTMADQALEGLVTGRPGQLTQLDTDLHVGFLSRMGGGSKIAFSEWLELCGSPAFDARTAQL